MYIICTYKVVVHGNVGVLRPHSRLFSGTVGGKSVGWRLPAVTGHGLGAVTHRRHATKALEEKNVPSMYYYFF